MARQISLSADVKKFAQKMVDGRIKETAELKTLATRKSIALLASMSKQRHVMYDHVEDQKPGKDVDSAYRNTEWWRTRKR